MKLKKEVKLAVTAIAAVVILIWGINFLKARALFDSNNVFYGVYDRVDGLKVSSGVEYRGYHVGQVTAIRFMGVRYDRVLVQFSVAKNLEIPANSVAAIQSSDLMGTKVICLVPGDASQYAQSGDTLQSQMSLGLVEQVNKQVQPLKLKTENILSSLDSVLTDVQSVLNSDTRQSIEKSLTSVQRTLSNLEHASGGVDSLITHQSVRIASILENIESVSENLRTNNRGISRGLGNIAAITDSLRQVDLTSTIRRADAVLCQVDSLMRKVNRGQGTLGELVNSPALYNSLADMGDNLNKLLEDFKANPKRYINVSVFGGGGKAEKERYGIALYESDQPLPLTSDLYIRYPEMKELRKHGRYVYAVGSYSSVNAAERGLETLKKEFKNAFILKL